MQKAIIVYDEDMNLERGYALKEVNKLLEQGWKVVSCTPMGGGGDSRHFASIVVLEKK